MSQIFHLPQAENMLTPQGTLVIDGREYTYDASKYNQLSIIALDGSEAIHMYYSVHRLSVTWHRNKTTATWTKPIGIGYQRFRVELSVDGTIVITGRPESSFHEIATIQKKQENITNTRVT